MQNMHNNQPTLDDLIQNTISKMAALDETSEEFRKLVVILDRLMKMKTENQPRRLRVSPDTMATVFGNLVAVLIVVGYERMHVMTSKAYGQFIKPIR
jgi:hypothetical protein